MQNASQKAQNSEEREVQRNIELIEMKENLKGDLESKMNEIFEGRIRSEIENRIMQNFERRMNEERKEWKNEIRELKFENHQLSSIIKD